MLSSIHPLGERGKGNRFGLTAAAFVAGSVAGGLATAAVAAGVGAAIRAVVDVDGDVATGVLAVVAAVGVVFEGTGRALPSLRRQVDEDWLHEFRGWVYGFGFGVQLGAGVATYITSAAVPLVVVAAVLVPELAAALSIGALFGLTRGLSILAVRDVHSPDRLVAFHRRLAATAPAVRRTSVIGLAIAAVVLATATAA